MSQTFELVCHETKKRIWIGQGWGKMATLYTGEKGTMEALKHFLNDHVNKSIEFVCIDTAESKIYEYKRYYAEEECITLSSSRVPFDDTKYSITGYESKEKK